MEFIVSNAGPARRVTDSSGTWLVAPLRLIVPGVLDGSQGPLYYPLNDVTQSAAKWDGMPLTRNHPTHNGQPISARTVLAEVGLGVVRKPVISNGALEAEGWFHEERTRRIDERIWNALIRGEKIELSTGLGTRNTKKSGTFKGRRYIAVARDYSPDHVAILTDGQRGACSLNDGCGVNNACACGGTCEKCAENAGKFGNPQSSVTGKFKRKGAGTGKGPVHEAAQGGALLFMDRDRELGAAARAEFKATGNNPASWVADEDTWEKAKEAAAKTYGEDTDAYWAATAAIYQRMGGEVIQHNTGVSMTRKQLIDALVANCDCWKNKKEVLANKELFSDDDLKTLKANMDRDKERIATLAAVSKEFGLAENAASTELVANAKRVSAILNAALDGEEEEEEEEDAENEGAMTPADEEEEMAEEEEEAGEDGKKKPPFNKKTKNKKKVANSMEAWLASAPPEARSSLNELIANDRRNRAKLVDKLIANAADDSKDRLRKKYSRMSSADLQELLDLVGNRQAAKEDDAILNYFGAGGAPAFVENASFDSGIEFTEEWPPRFVPASK